MSSHLSSFHFFNVSSNDFCEDNDQLRKKTPQYHLIPLYYKCQYKLVNIFKIYLLLMIIMVINC